MERFRYNVPIFHISIIFPNFVSDDETLFFFNIIFLISYFRNFIQLRKTHLHKQILPMFAVNYLKKCMTKFRLVKKNDVTLTYKYGNFIRSEFYGICAFLVLASATAKTSAYWISSKSIYFYSIEIKLILMDI